MQGCAECGSVRLLAGSACRCVPTREGRPAAVQQYSSTAMRAGVPSMHAAFTASQPHAPAHLLAPADSDESEDAAPPPKKGAAAPKAAAKATKPESDESEESDDEGEPACLMSA